MLLFGKELFLVFSSEDMYMRNKSLCYLSSSSVKGFEEEAPMKRGIVTILGSDCEKTKAASLRRTLSADMSSKKWLEQNGFFSPMKKIASSEELVIQIDSSASSSEDEEECEKSMGQDDVWASIQLQKERNEIRRSAQMDVWGSILSQKSENSSNFLPPYVHPLVKRSASVLSEQSLEICTESLGSETGSDGFCSEIMSDGDEEERQRGAPESNSLGNLNVAKYKKSKALPFPPPLSSIAGGDGASVHMQSHRKNGRLILEAVSVLSRNYLHADRRDGRLLLTLINGPITQENEVGRENEVDGFEEVFDNMEEIDQVIEVEVDDGGGDGGYEEEEVVVEKFEVMTLGNKNPSWGHKFNKAKNSMEPEEVVVEEELSIPKSLPPPLPPPPPPRVARLIPSPPPPTATFNPYEYFWRNKTAAASHGFINPMNTTPKSTPLKNGTKAYEHQDLVLMKGNKAKHFVPYLKGCKESRRSLLIWEPCCIASS